MAKRRPLRERMPWWSTEPGGLSGELNDQPAFPLAIQSRPGPEDEPELTSEYDDEQRFNRRMFGVVAALMFLVIAAAIVSTMH
jgi:hypothetical protein